jgi:hypothetical protein
MKENSCFWRLQVRNLRYSTWMSSVPLPGKCQDDASICPKLFSKSFFLFWHSSLWHQVTESVTKLAAKFILCLNPPTQNRVNIEPNRSVQAVTHVTCMLQVIGLGLPGTLSLLNPLTIAFNSSGYRNNNSESSDQYFLLTHRTNPLFRPTLSNPVRTSCYSPLGQWYSTWGEQTQGVRKAMLETRRKHLISIRAKHRNRSNFESALILELTKILPRIEMLACQKPAQSSH